MPSLPHTSVRTRMSLTVAATVFACTMLTVLAFLFADFRQAIEGEARRLESTAAIVAAATSEATANSDGDKAREALRAIRDIANAQYVSVRDYQGRLIAEMGGGTVLNERVATIREVSALNMFFLEHLKVSVPIRHRGLVIGSVTLQSGIGWIKDDFLYRAEVALVLSALGILLAFSVAFRRVNVITKPLRDLSRLFSDIGENFDLTKRLEKSRDDEVGVLVGAFNEMFDKIAERDKRLQLHRDTLEQTVAERTSDLVEAKDEAERANAAKSEFLAMMGHEIRTPMNGMMVMAEMLAAAPLGPRHLRYAEIINRSGRNLLTIINDMLDLSKIESGRFELEAAPFSIDDLIADVTGLFAERAREKCLALTFAIAPDVPSKLAGDATRLTQVISNLVNNALKFTDSGGVSINVSAAPGARGSTAHLVIRCQDTGIGIPVGKLSHVFERFTQADASITRRFGGTGLGLAISKRLMEAMGGSISVESQEGAGSTFTVSLSLAVEEQALAMPSLKGKRIAIFQNEPIHADALRFALERMGASVSCIQDAGKLGGIDLIMLEDGCAVPGESGCPVVSLMPRMNSGATRKAVLEYPLSRADLQRIGNAVFAGEEALLHRNSVHQRDKHLLPEFRGLNALVVDDNPVNREVLQEALAHMGARSKLANDGEQALSIMQDEDFDIVFMDCSMPGMDGFVATRTWRSRETSKRLPIVALTAYGEGQAGEDWRQAGMDAFVTKPFTIPALANIIVRLVPGKFSGTLTIPANETAAERSDSIMQLPLFDPQTLSMIDMLSARSGGAAGQRIFGLFKEHAPAALHELQSAISEKRESVIKSLAHNLKSMCSSAGAMRLGALAAEAESRCDRLILIDEYLLDDLQECLTDTVEAIDQRYVFSPAHSEPAQLAEIA
jgi:signal transduction histidine kinase/CheY-like chemotaxis protein